MSEPPVRIAAWSGPRNISTAMMRSFESRDDCAVVDEPFYAHYLLATGAPHPGRDDVIRAHQADPALVVASLTGPVPGGKRLFYQKHMTHHMLPAVPRDWLGDCRHFFLIRDPAEVIVSFSKIVPNPSPHDLGLPQQAELFDRVADLIGRPPPVVDARDILLDPRGTLELLCRALGIPFSDRMLGWEPGRRPTDGAWAPHWYASVERSTGFDPYRPRTERVPDHLRAALEAARPVYAALARHRLVPGGATR